MLVSRAVRDVADLTGNYIYIDCGEQRAKHVSRPIQIFSIRPRDSEPTLTSSAHPKGGMLRFWGADLSGRKFGFDLELETPQSKAFMRDRDSALRQALSVSAPHK